MQLYSSNIISTKGFTTLVYEVEVRRNGLNKGFFIKFILWQKKKKGLYCIVT